MDEFKEFEQSKKEYVESNNKKLKPYGLKIVEKNKFFKYLLIILAVFVIGFLYLTYSGYLKSTVELICGNSTQICEKQVCECDFNYTCNPKLDCSFPNEIVVRMVNSS